MMKSLFNPKPTEITTPNFHDLVDGNFGEGGMEFPEHALKIYKSDQQFKYLLVHQETSAKNVVMLALQEFGITELSSNYTLCEVNVKVSIDFTKKSSNSFKNPRKNVSFSYMYLFSYRTVALVKEDNQMTLPI